MKCLALNLVGPVGIEPTTKGLWDNFKLYIIQINKVLP